MHTKKKVSFFHSLLSIFCHQCFLHIVEPLDAVLHKVGYKFNEVFQIKQGRYADILAAEVSEMMKSNSLDVSSS